MKYLGSKRRIAKHILPIILKNRQADQWYVEPFVGSGNVIEHVTGLRWGNDSHFYLIECLIALRDGWIPPKDVSESEYKAIRAEPHKYDTALVGYVGFNLSFGGKWWGGYRRDRVGKRAYDREAYTEVMKQAPKLKGCVFSNKQYWDLALVPNSIIYCDPPYANTTSYSDKSFDHKLFWEWCRNMSRLHSVFISEYTAPSDFRCVWEKNHSYMMEHSNPQQVRKERLFTLAQ